jgi:hypothetical protein
MEHMTSSLSSFPLGGLFDIPRDLTLFLRNKAFAMNTNVLIKIFSNSLSSAAV